VGAAQFVEAAHVAARLGNPPAGIGRPLIHGGIERGALQFGRQRVAVDRVPVALAVDLDGLLAGQVADVDVWVGPLVDAEVHRRACVAVALGKAALDLQDARDGGIETGRTTLAGHGRRRHGAKAPLEVAARVALQFRALGGHVRVLHELPADLHAPLKRDAALRGNHRQATGDHLCAP